jgi:hypothetical protein
VNPGKTLTDFVSQINGDGSIEVVHGEVTEAVIEFIQHEEGAGIGFEIQADGRCGSALTS